jgi:hypothetical protein
MNLIKKSGPRLFGGEGKSALAGCTQRSRCACEKSMNLAICTSHPAREGIVAVMSDALSVIVTHCAVHAHSGGIVAAHGLVADEAPVARAAPE